MTRGQREAVRNGAAEVTQGVVGLGNSDLGDVVYARGPEPKDVKGLCYPP